MIKSMCIIIISILILIFSCNSDDNSIVNPQDQSYLLQDTTIVFIVNSIGGDYICNDTLNFCGAYIQVDSRTKFKISDPLPDSITNKTEFWNRDYIATLKVINGNNCLCYYTYPTRYDPDTMQIAEILAIREKFE